MTRILAFLALLLSCSAAIAGPHVLTHVDAKTKNGQMELVTRTIGLIDMADVTADGSCSQFVGPVRVTGIQYTESGGTLQQFHFLDRHGNRWAVPTNIGKLDDAARDAANNFIRVGQTYFAHIETCGSAGFANLISLYELRMSFGIGR